MGHYLVNFSVYTMAMAGLIMFALFVFKCCTGNGFSKKSSMLNVIDLMKLSPRKTLYVIKVENEKYLIAADIDTTSLIAKLDDKEDKIPDIQKQKFSDNTIKTDYIKKERTDKSLKLKNFDGLKSIEEFSSVVDFKPKSKKQPVMRELALKLKQQ